MKRLGFLLFFLAGCGPGGSPPEPPSVADCTAFLQWEAPIKRMNGDLLLLSELSKFTIYVSESSDPADMLFELIIEVNDSNMISWEIRELTDSHHYFWVSATDTDNRESAPSNVEDKDCSVPTRPSQSKPVPGIVTEDGIDPDLKLVSKRVDK